MTSDASSLFAWIHLPGRPEPVVCGRFTHRSSGAGEAGEFVYGRSYLARAEAVPLDPVVLPLQERAFSTTHLGGWFSALLDSGPDDWGRRLIEQMHGPQDTVGYLLRARGQNVGALAFSPAPDTPPPDAPAPLGVEALERLLEVHRTVEHGEAVASEYRDLLMQGTSAGGARPKTTVEHEGRLWLAKFPSSRDRPEEPPVPLISSGSKFPEQVKTKDGLKQVGPACNLPPRGMSSQASCGGANCLQVSRRCTTILRSWQTLKADAVLPWAWWQ